MDLQPVTYRGRTLAAATANRFFLTDALERRPSDDPVLRMVVLMCDYAGQIIRGERPEPYTESGARRYARDRLIPEELLDRDSIDVVSAASWVGVPTHELEVGRAEHRQRACKPSSRS